ncbi:hypothetical protein EHS25_009440 [Saitozyma podzolica]|uniref:Uncharacterized protein n=1 Tax=Saitozyma podzolica TaxID=1890683 RepID=A0A427YJ92_9TREE|nr:hypothetical protein EHS25_009440 [Saitozyma podzolica]
MKSDVPDSALSMDPTESTDPPPSPPPDPRRYQPYSPRPHLFDNLPPGKGPQASEVLTDMDYRRLRSKAFTAGLVPAILTAGAVSYFSPNIARALLPHPPASPGKLRTTSFILSLSGVMAWKTYTMLTSEISSARERVRHARLPRTAEGEVVLSMPERGDEQGPNTELTH